MAELVDVLDLGSSVQKTWGFESPLSHNVRSPMAEERFEHESMARTGKLQSEVSGRPKEFRCSTLNALES